MVVTMNNLIALAGATSSGAGISLRRSTPSVAPMQSPDPPKADDGRWRGRARLDGTTERGVLVEPEMRAIAVLVVNKRFEQAVQVALVQDDDVVEQFPGGPWRQSVRRLHSAKGSDS